MENVSKLIKYGFFASVAIAVTYRLINPPKISTITHPRLFEPVSLEVHNILMKYLGGIRDGGYKTDRELIGINERF